MNWLVCYDISNPKRLRRVAKYLEKCGIRVQYSFFQVEMSERQFVAMKKGLLSIINTRQDRLGFYPVCRKCSGKQDILGRGMMLHLESFEIL